jgi:hypothetical protein
MLTFYQYGTYLDKYKNCLPQTTQHTTQNTTQHNNQQNELPPYPPVALPPLSMGRAAAPPNLGAASPHGSVAGAQHLVCVRDGRFPCLGQIFNPHQKIERWWGVSIHILRTVVLDYGELLALLVIPTRLLHVGPGFETCLVP